MHGADAGDPGPRGARAQVVFEIAALHDRARALLEGASIEPTGNALLAAVDLAGETSVTIGSLHLDSSVWEKSWLLLSLYGGTHSLGSLMLMRLFWG